MDLVGTSGASSYIAARYGDCGLSFLVPHTTTYVRTPDCETGRMLRQFQRKSRREVLGVCRGFLGEIGGRFTRIFCFVPYDDLLRRGRNTVTPANEPFCVLSASSAFSTV